MQNGNRTFYFQADATALGGTLEQPFHCPIPSQASAALPTSGGFAHVVASEFNHHGLISCARSETHVSGRSDQTEGHSTLVTTVVEDLNILEIVRARRVIAQVSVTMNPDGLDRRISLAGSQIEGLRIAGRDVALELEQSLVGPAAHWEDYRRAEEQQRRRVMGWIHAQHRPVDWDWVLARYGWSSSTPTQTQSIAVCSMATSIERSAPGISVGPFVYIPEFGRIGFGELQVARDWVRLSMIRADLGCHVHGVVVGGVGGSGGTMMPPILL